MAGRYPFPILVIFFPLMAAFLLFAGCDNRREDFRTLKLAVSENPTTLDPALIIDVSGGNIAAKLFNGLVRVDKNLKIIGDLAESWDISPDGRTYNFKIRSGVFFNNGRELTADDVKYSFQRVLDPATASSRGWVFEKIKGAREYESGKAADVEGIKVIGKHGLQITLEEPFGPFLWVLTMPNAYVVPAEEVMKWGKDFSYHAAGTGPFKLKEWRHDYRMLLEANKEYFGERPRVDFIEYRIIPDEFSTFAEFENGNLDIVGVPGPEFKRLRKEPGRAEYIYAIPGLNIYYLGFNCERPPFDNPKVRKAINMAIDREKIAANILDGRVVPARSALPPELPGGAKPETGYRYDPQKAAQMLGDEGIKKDFEIDIYQNRTKEASNILEAVQHYLGAAGIKSHIVQREWSSFKEAVIKGEADMFLLSWWADYPDAENFLFPNFHSTNLGAGGNKARFQDAVIDKMIDESRGIADDDIRNKLYGKINEAVFEEAPWVFLWHKTDYVITQPWVKGYYPYPIYNSDKGTDVWIERR